MNKIEIILNEMIFLYYINTHRVLPTFPFLYGFMQMTSNVNLS